MHLYLNLADMKGLTIKKNNVEKLKIGTGNGLLLIMFHHIDNKRLRISTFRADVTEYETGDRYLYAREPLNPGDMVWHIGCQKDLK